jgi:hypothetical protein
VFPYTIVDTSLPHAGNFSAKVTIIIPTPLPVKDDLYIAAYNMPRVVGPSESILTNDGPGGPNCTISVKSAAVAIPPSEGTVTGLDFATGAFTFTPARGFWGNVTFTYGGCRRLVGQDKRHGNCEFWSAVRLLANSTHMSSQSRAAANDKQ